MKKGSTPPLGGENRKGGGDLSPCQATVLSTSPPLSTFVVVVEKREKKREEEREKKVGGNNREVGGEGREVESAQKIANKRSHRMVAVNERGQRIGEDHPRAVLTDHEVELMLELRAEGFSFRWLAEKFEVSKSCVFRTCHGQHRAQMIAGYRRTLVTGGKR